MCLILPYFTGLGVSLDSDKPHLVGIDEDLLSTGITLYHLKDGDTTIGSEDYNDIILKGIHMQPQHCIITLKDGIATLLPQPEAMCKINAEQCKEATRLYQGCVIVLGKTNMFRYNHEKIRQIATFIKKSAKLSQFDEFFFFFFSIFAKKGSSLYSYRKSIFIIWMTFFMSQVWFNCKITLV